MRHFRLLLILAASAAIAYAFIQVDKMGATTKRQALVTQGVAFAGGLLAGFAILLKNKSKTN